MHYWCLGEELHLFQRAQTEATKRFQSKKEIESVEENNRAQKRKGRPIKMSLEEFCEFYFHEYLFNWFDDEPVDADEFCKKYSIKRSTYFSLKNKMLKQNPNLSFK